MFGRSARPRHSEVEGAKRPPWAIHFAPISVASVVLAAILVVAGVLGLPRLIAPPSVSHVVRASGTIEATQSEIASKVQGRLVSLRVRDGEAVHRGQLVAVLEDLEPSIAVEQARATAATAAAQLQTARAAYALQRSAYQTTLAQAGSGARIAGARVGAAGVTLEITRESTALAVAQAQAKLAAAHSASVRAQIELRRAKGLVASGDMPQRLLDDATNASAAAAAELRAASAAVALAESQRRNVEARRLDVAASAEQQRASLAVLAAAQAEWELVNQRQAQVAAAEAALTLARTAVVLAQNRVRETELRAPYDGFVISHDVEAGDLVQPASAVLTIGDLSHPYVNVYVTESDLPHIKTGASADVFVDGMPGRTYTGTVTELAKTAEFTPANVQTKQERIDYLVFRVKIELNDASGTLKPALPVDADIHV